jgi:hypothetical protein
MDLAAGAQGVPLVQVGPMERERERERGRRTGLRTAVGRRNDRGLKMKKKEKRGEKGTHLKEPSRKCLVSRLVALRNMST